MIVGAISANALMGILAGEASDIIMPIQPKQLKPDMYALKVSRATLKNKTPPCIYSCFAGLTERPGIERIQRLLGEALEPVPTSHNNNDVFRSKKTTAKNIGEHTLVEVVACAHMQRQPSSKPTFVVWSTRVLTAAATEGPAEYWLTKDSMDASAFLTGYLTLKDQKPNGHMLAYQVDDRYEPLLDGMAEHGPSYKLHFAKHMRL